MRLRADAIEKVALLANEGAVERQHYRDIVGFVFLPVPILARATDAHVGAFGGLRVGSASVFRFCTMAAR